MNEKQRRTRLGLLVAAHLLVGLGVITINMTIPRLDWPEWSEPLNIGLICSQTVLLGAWAGFSPSHWSLRLVGLAAGLLWLAMSTMASNDPFDMDAAGEMLAVFSAPVVIIALGCLICRRWYAHVERRSEWILRPFGEELQFTLTSIVALTAIVAALLSMGRLVQWMGGDNRTPVVAFVLAFVACIDCAMLLWAGLGQGRTRIRGPVGLLVVGGSGLLISYYFQSEARQYLMDSAITFAGAAYALASLLVVRSCGYRLVRIRKIEPDVKDVTVQEQARAPSTP